MATPTPEEKAAAKAKKEAAALAAKDAGEGANTGGDNGEGNKPLVAPEGYQMVSTADLKALIEAGKNAEKLIRTLQEERDEDRDGTPKTIKKITEYTASIRKYEGVPVVGYVNHSRLPNGRRFVYQKPDPTNPKEKDDWIDLILHGKDEPVSMLYLDFLNMTDKVVCKIKKIDTKEQEAPIIEYVNKVEYGDWSRKETDQVVPVEVTYVERTITLTEPESGEDLVINELFVNQ